MSPGTAERRPQGNGTGDVLNLDSVIVPAPSDARLDLWDAPTGCQECGGRLGVPKPGRHICPACHREHLDGLDRRRGAELRMVPRATDLAEPYVEVVVIHAADESRREAS